MIDHALLMPRDTRDELKPIFNIIGIAGLLVGLAWIVQACGFSDGDGEASWILMGAIIAGIGAGFFLTAHADVI